jgi:hypothetical protein
MFQVPGHSAATVISPRGGVMARSGMIFKTPSNPQNDGGKRGQTISTLTFCPRGGKKGPAGTSAGSFRSTGWDTCERTGNGELGGGSIATLLTLVEQRKACPAAIDNATPNYNENPLSLEIDFGCGTD